MGLSECQLQRNGPSGRTDSKIELTNLALGRLGQKVADRDHDVFFDLLADNMVFAYSAPEGTPLSEQLHGKQAVVERLGDALHRLLDGSDGFAVVTGAGSDSPPVPT